MDGQGDDAITGTIEGLGDGRPLDWCHCADAELRDLHLETNLSASTFERFQNLRLASVHNTAGRMRFIACRSASVEAYHGARLDFDAACSGITLGRVYLDDDHDGRVTDASGSAQAIAGSASLVTRADLLDGLTERASLENLFHNPYLDIWSAGPDALPDGVQLGGGCGSDGVGAPCVVVNRETARVWSGNPAGISARFTVPVALLAQDRPGFVLVAPHDTATAERWFSVLLPVFVESGPPLDVFVHSGQASPVHVAQVTSTGTWVPVRATVRVPLGHGFAVLLRAVAPASQAPTPVPGHYLVGGCAIVAGTSAPQDLSDHGRRAAHIVGRVDHTPAFVGQRARVQDAAGGTTRLRWYMAAGTRQASDWIPL